MSAPTTTPATASTAAPQAPAAPAAPATATLVLPHANTMVQAARLAMQADKAIMMDYYVDTHNNKAFVGEDQQTNERMLVKSSDEFTSLIQHTYKVGEDYIMVTENSIYVVSGKIQKRRIQASKLREE